LTLRLLSILRLLFPYALLPSTTALGTIHPQGRELGLKAGGNVVMPKLSPVHVRKLYELYENKICTGEEAAQCRGCLEQRVKSAGYEIVTARGDLKRSRRGFTETMCRMAIIGMSGGLDSRVAALLMRDKGYTCMGATMKLYQNEDIGLRRRAYLLFA
jgi:Predicted tRNA(5-methylaminomethyl-2-thiouridylate) methyltransferase, contains the PP-loop ATPase domain